MHLISATFVRALVLTAAVLTVSGCSPMIFSRIGSALFNSSSPGTTSVLRSVVSGNDHSCFLDSDGSLRCWGDNSYSQVKENKNLVFETIPGITPANVLPAVNLAAGGAYPIDAIYAGDRTSCLSIKSSLQCSGSLVGDGTAVASATPYEVLSSGLEVASIGEEHVCYLVNGGQLLCYGDNTHGEVDFNNVGGISLSPVSSIPSGTGVLSVVVGDNHTCITLFNSGDTGVYCWGDNSLGQAGDGAAGGGDVGPSQVIAQNAVKIAAGKNHTCAIVNDELWCWGDNSSGQIGNNGVGLFVDTPFQTIASGVTDVSAGANHTCAIVNDALQCWGSNITGQIGTGVVGGTVNVPTEAIPAGLNLSHVTLGTVHSCVVAGGDEVYCFGSNSVGQVGDGTSGNDVSTPTKVVASGTIPNLTSIDQIAAGKNHTCLLINTVAGKMTYCFGDNNNGEFGITETSATPTTSPEWQLGPLIAGKGYTYTDPLEFKPVSAGYYHTCVIGAAGDLSCFGNNQSGQIGNGTTGDSVTAPYQVFSSDVSSVSAGALHTCAVVGGALECWGNNDFGQIGNGESGTNVTIPYTVFTSGVTAVAVGYAHTCAVVHSTLQCFGSSSHGQIGTGQSDGLPFGSVVPLPGGKIIKRPFTAIPANVTAVAAGLANTCAIVSGEMLCFGSNFFNINGDTGGSSENLTPFSVFGAGVTAIDVRMFHTCAIVNGDLSCFGSSAYGQAGNGYTSSPDAPGLIGIPAAAGPTAVTTGLQSTCVILTGGELKCFGQTTSIGKGFNGFTDTPTTVIASGVNFVSSGSMHTCAAVGTELQCSGDNSFGQLGKGVSGNGVDPEQIFSSGVTKVVTSGVHTCAIVSGALKCWGDNTNGQIGDGNTYTSITSPYQVFASGVTDVAVGIQHTCAVVSGSLKCFGGNAQAQIGKGFVSVDSGVPYTTIAAGVERVFAGSYTTCALKSDQTMWCWGPRASGLFNNGVSGGRINSPTQITLPAGTLIDFSMGATHACGIFETAGTRKLICWGGNSQGNITNDGVFGNGLSSYEVIQSSGLTQVSAGTTTGARTCIIDNGAVSCFGENNLGAIDPLTVGSPVHNPFTMWGADASSVAAHGANHICALIDDDVRCTGVNSEATRALGYGAAIGLDTDVTILNSVGP